MNRKKISLMIVSVLMLQACASTFEKAESFVVNDEWGKAVIEYRKSFQKDPGDIELKSRLMQTEMRAADFYYRKGLKLLEQDDLDGALVQFQLGLVAKPEHGKLIESVRFTLAQKGANAFYAEALRNQELNKKNDVIKLLTQALSLYPDHEQANNLLNKYHLEKKQVDLHKAALESKAPITLNFKDAKLKTVFKFIAKSFGINVIFDEAVVDVPVTIFAKEVTFDQALNLMLRISKNFYKKIGNNTILIAADDAAKRGQYEDYILRTYYLKYIAAREVADLIKNVLGVKKMVINEELNSVMIRDTDEMLKLVAHLIEINDRKPAEMILEVEILEVNRTKALQLGLDFGSQITTAYQPFTGSFRQGLNNPTFTVPNVTFRYFKQDVDAKTLANPKLRVIDNKQAKIHIGDRVPLRASTVTDATGQTRTTFEYHDIGIRLQITPDVHLDNSTTIKLNLEVSSLGQDLGPPGEPAFSIGTRNADTIMLLKDGETAILGGLIRDEERESQTKVPGLGDIPLIGALFTTFDTSSTRTDILLTITPHIIRSADLPSRNTQRIFSGTEKQYSTKPLFAFLENPAYGGFAEIVIDNEQNSSAPLAKTDIATNQPVNGSNTAALSFGKPMYEVSNDELISIDVVAENINDIGTMPIELLFNASMMEYVQAEAGNIGDGQLDIKHDEAKGLIRLDFKGLNNQQSGKTVLARINLRAKDPGVSYLIYKALSYTDNANQTQQVDIRASRVVIK